MEIDCLLSHGMSYYMKDKTFECSDHYSTYICDECGLIANVNKEKNIACCSACNNKSNFSHINLPYASKLMWSEIMAMGLIPRFKTE